MTLIGTLVLAVFASRDLPSWTERARPMLRRCRRPPPNGTARWTALGLTRPHEALRAAVARLIEVGWAGRSDSAHHLARADPDGFR